MIKIKNLSKSYGKVSIVKNLSLEIKKGSIFGFLGPNGAGKTTTMKMVVGLSIPDKGEIKIENGLVEKNKEAIGFMPEDPYFYDHLSGKEFLDFMGSLFKKPLSSRAEQGEVERSSKISPPVRQVSRSRNDISESIDNLLEKVGLAEAGKKKIMEYSKGMKQRLGLAQAIVNDPDYLFLDEPLDGLDPIGRREFKKILLDLKKRGKTIFFNSHILSDVEEICDQIGVINHGKLIYSGDVKKFRGNKSLEDAFVSKLT